MIRSAEHFVALRSSAERTDYQQAATEQATFETWEDVIARFPKMRSWVAHNKTVPLEILRILAKDADRVVRGSVADKRKLDRALFESLSRDPDETVRQRIAHNKKTPADILERLTSDESPFVSEAALRARGADAGSQLMTALGRKRSQMKDRNRPEAAIPLSA